MKRTKTNKIEMNPKRWSSMMFTFVFLIGIFCQAQSIDQARMDRDLKIAENILSTLANDNSRLRLFDNVESSYIPDYGVVFSIPQSMYIYTSSEGASVVFQSSGSGSAYVVAPEPPEPPLADDDEVIVARDKRVIEINQAKLKEEAEKNIREQLTIFLADYADLIGQLQPSDRIVVQTKGSSERFFYRGGGKTIDQQGSLSAQIMKSDLMAYKQGKLDREKLIEKITFKSEGTDEVAKDVELFATIFSRLYEPDLSSTYYLASRNIRYARLEGLGITFSMKFYSSSSDEGLHTIRTTGETGLTQKERDERVNAMYPEFEQSFKENLLDYGRTVKSLDAKEAMIFKVRLTECKECDMPGEIEVRIKGETLQKFDKGSLSRENAIKEIEVERKG